MRAATATHPAGDGPPLHFRVRTGDGRRRGSRELEVTSTERPGSGRRVLYLRDVTNRRRRERELERMAYTDHLTGLPNRAPLFQEMAAPSLEERCLLVLDLDGFKAVNDVAGHEAGDQLLVEVARRLNTVVRDDDLVARLGGDEFAVLVTGSMTEAEEVAQRVVDVLALPHRVERLGLRRRRQRRCRRARRRPAVSWPSARPTTRCARPSRPARAASGWRRRGSTTSSSRTPTSPPSSTRAMLQLRLDAGLRRRRADRARARRPGLAARRARHRSAAMELWARRRAAGPVGRAAAVAAPPGLRREVAALPDRPLAVADQPARRPRHPRRAWPPRSPPRSAVAASPPSRLMLSFTEETLLTSSAALVPELEAARRTGVRLCLDNYGMGHSIFALLARISLDVVRVDLTALAPRDDTARALQVLGLIVRTADELRPDRDRRRHLQRRDPRRRRGGRRRAAARAAPAARAVGGRPRRSPAHPGGPRPLTVPGVTNR